MPRPSIFSGTFWRSYWISIRRSGRDRRDLKAALAMTLGLIYFFAYYGTLLWNFVWDRGDILIVSFAGVIVCGGMLLVWGNNKLDERNVKRADEIAADQSLRARLAADGFFVAVLLARAGSEQMLKEKELPQQITVITRSVQIDKLRRLGKWDLLPEAARDLLLLPDGHWSAGQISSVRPCFETLRCVRWVLCLDERLEPLTDLPRMNYKESQTTFEQPEKILSGRSLLPVWDIRVERNKADKFFARCFAEAIGRGLMTATDSDGEKWAADVNETMRQPHMRDVLAGVNTVSELDDSALMYLVAVSFQRHQCLQLLMELQDGKDRWVEWEEICFPRLKSVTSFGDTDA